MRALVIGGGPAGLMAAEQLLQGGVAVDLCDAMPSLGRKFLLAGIGGLNITHAEPASAFLSRYGTASDWLRPSLDSFSADVFRAWVHELGVETFVGSSGRVFPREMKAAPLLRRWLARLRAAGLRVHTRHRWLGWQEGAAGEPLWRFSTPDGERALSADVVVLALGGGSWARLGSDGTWLPWLAGRGVALTPLRPANCGFEVGWSEVLRARAGEPLKNITISLPWLDAPARRGECVLTRHGLEGSLIYALSAALRERIETSGGADIVLDLLPDHDQARLACDLARPRGKQTLTRQWQRAGLTGIKSLLLREVAVADDLGDAVRLAALAKALPVRLLATRPLDEAISSAGGVAHKALDDDFMLKALPGVFCAGEMLDWEAPTGGYLLTACMATGRVAGQGALAWVRRRAAVQS